MDLYNCLEHQFFQTLQEGTAPFVFVHGKYAENEHLIDTQGKSLGTIDLTNPIEIAELLKNNEVNSLLDVILDVGSFQYPLIHCVQTTITHPKLGRFFHVDGVWYSLHPGWFEAIHFDLGDILKRCLVPNYLLPWKDKGGKKDKEKVYNALYAKRNEYIHADVVLYRGIEIADLITFEGGTRLIHVKANLGNDTRAHCSQLERSADLLYEVLQNGDTSILEDYYQELVSKDRIDPAILPQEQFITSMTTPPHIFVFAIRQTNELETFGLEELSPLIDHTFLNDRDFFYKKVYDNNPRAATDKAFSHLLECGYITERRRLTNQFFQIASQGAFQDKISKITPAILQKTDGLPKLYQKLCRSVSFMSRSTIAKAEIVKVVNYIESRGFGFEIVVIPRQ